MDKLDIYRKLGVPEVWFYERGSLTFFSLRDESYEQSERSRLVPAVDPDFFLCCTAGSSQAAAVRALRAALRQ